VLVKSLDNPFKLSHNSTEQEQKKQRTTQMKKYNIHDDLKTIAQSIKKDFGNDSIIRYLCTSAIRTKDELNRQITIGMIHAHILDKYNFEIWAK
jgi:hypothetical protein